LLAPVIEERLGRSVPGGANAMAIDPFVLAIVAGMGVVITAALSLTPLIASWHGGPGDPLRREGRSGTESRSSRRARSVLIALEVAGSLALLVGSGLMIRTVVRLVSTDLGFSTTHVVRAHLALPAQAYPDPASLATFYDRLIDDLAQAPDREPSAVANFPPFFDPPRRRVEVETGGLSGLDASVIGVGGDYFGVLGIPLVEGRSFTRSDRLGSEPVVIVSETLARRISPDGHVVGRRVRTIEEQSSSAPLGSWRSIVGVTRDVRQTFSDENLRDAYLPVLQIPNRFASVYLKTPSPAWMTHLRTVVSRINADVSLGADPPLDVAAATLLAGPRFLASVLTGFALFTALLAVFGVYGVIAYAVEQREREIAIRVALGASVRSVIAMFVKQGAVVVAAGIALGLVGARVVGQVLQTQLYGVRSFDLPTFAATGLLLASAGLLATWWPARRAAQQDPMHALKEE
jgi:predicted permease